MARTRALPATVAQAPIDRLEPAREKNLELEQALTLHRLAVQRPYYDAASDRQDQEAYYGELLGPQQGQDLFEPLSNLVRRTHENELSYQPSRYLYPWVDLQPDGMLKSIYSGELMDPEEAIRQDLDPAARAAALLLRPELAAAQEALDLAQEAYNCEHVVPQSWFGKDQPMRGDLHHLFASEPRCNSFRGNLAYYDFPDFDSGDRTDCGRADHGRRKFEPDGGKGAVARATLYFLLRYPHEISQYNREDIDTLLRWHQDHPVSLYERHRNAGIFELQGNRNPLVDCPEWAEQIDFSRGLSGRRVATPAECVP